MQFENINNNSKEKVYFIFWRGRLLFWFYDQVGFWFSLEIIHRRYLIEFKAASHEIESIFQKKINNLLTNWLWRGWLPKIGCLISCITMLSNKLLVLYFKFKSCAIYSIKLGCQKRNLTLDFLQLKQNYLWCWSPECWLTEEFIYLRSYLLPSQL